MKIKKLFTSLRLSDLDKEEIEQIVSDFEAFNRSRVQVLFLVKDR